MHKSASARALCTTRYKRMLQTLTYLSHAIGLVSLTLFGVCSQAQTPDIPEPLKPWQVWVLHNHTDLNCPLLNNKQERLCLWYKTLNLTATDQQLSFELGIRTYDNAWVTLPGDRRYWPVSVDQAEDGKAPRKAVVTERFGKPAVQLPPGEWSIRGKLDWEKMPASISLPPSVSLVKASVNGEPLMRPTIDKQQKLWLSRTTAIETTANKLQLHVYRHLEDTLPAQLTTYLEMDITGEEREENLGQTLPAGFVAERLIGSIPSQLSPANELVIQAKPGRWLLQIRARYQTAPLTQLVLPRANSIWPEEEAWAFTPQPQLRQVEISGARSIDPQQYHLPDPLKQLPAYLLRTEESVIFDELQQPTSVSNNSQWQLYRQLWLDFSGQGFTYQDQLTELDGNLRRLNTQAPYELGRVTENNRARVITTVNNETGIELRNTYSQITAEGRVSTGSALPISGWKTDISELGITLHLPPAWSVLAVTGADTTTNVWLSNWTLWSLFLVLITTLAIHKVLSLPTALIAFLTLVFSYQRPDSPVFIWLNLTVILAILPFAKGRLESWLKRYQHLSLAALVLMLLPFSISQLQQAIYPQLEYKPYAQPIHTETTSAMVKKALRTDAEIQEFTATAAPEILLKSSEKVMSDTIRRNDPGNDLGKYNSAEKIAEQQMGTENLQQIQTGPGIPQWHWRVVNLGWHGPVAEDETMQFYFAPPWLNRLGNFITVALCWLLAWRFLRASYPTRPSSLTQTPSKPGVAQALILTLLTLPLTLHSPTTEADVIIDTALLKELEQRLVQPPQCAPQCIAVQGVKIVLTDKDATIEVQLHAAAASGYQLPSSNNEWQASRISLDQQPAATFKRDNNDTWVAVPSGRHTLTITGSLNEMNQANWNFHEPVSNVEILGSQWTYSGLDGLFLTNGNLLISRVQKSDTKITLESNQFPVFLRVQRHLTLAKDWRVHTRVVRIAPTTGPISMALPLLNNEQVVTPSIQTNNGKATINLAAEQAYLSWDSLLPNAPLTLQASNDDSWVEEWTIDQDENWHVSYSGLEPIKNLSNNGPVADAKHRYHWQPWRGDSVTLNAFKPEAVAGNSLTLEHTRVTHDIGQRVTETQIETAIRSSIGQPLTVHLPAQAELQDIQLDGRQQPLPLIKNNQIQLQVPPGEYALEIKWKRTQPVTWLESAESIGFSEPSTNIQQTLNLPRDRWVLAVGGPTLGPALLIWGAVIIVVIAAAFLGRSKLTPLSTGAWLLLGLGLCTTALLTPLLVIACMFALAWRGRLSQTPPTSRFKLIQVGLTALSIISLLVLVLSVPYSLLSSPDMHVVGNGSSSHVLQWYSDHSMQQLPQPWVLSLPLWAFKLLMLAWSIWLANALVRWLPWGWRQLNHLGFWPEKNTTKSE